MLYSKRFRPGGLLMAVLVVSALLVQTTIVPLSAAAQRKGGNRGNRGQGLGNLPEVEAKGTIIGISAGVLQVETSGGQKWFVSSPFNARQIRFTGSAEPSWLTPGMFVQFTARFNAKGVAVGSVTELTVLTPGIRREGEESPTQPGLVPDGPPGKVVSFSDDDAKTAKNTKIEETTPFKVTGLIQGFEKGRMTVAAGRAAVQVPLDEKAIISVELNDLRPALIGDAVEIRGRAVAQDKVVPMWLSVSANKPLTGAAPKKGKTRADVLPPLNKKPSKDEETSLPPLGTKVDTPEKSDAKESDAKKPAKQPETAKPE